MTHDPLAKLRKVRPGARRAPNLVTTFTPDEVRAMDDLLKEVMLELASREIELLDAQALMSVADKFARLREKARGGS